MVNVLTRPNALALIPPEVSREILAGVRKQSVAMQLMKQLPNMGTDKREQPVLTMLPIADFVNGDQGMKVTTNAAWDKKVMVAGEIAAVVPIPQAVLDDADYDIWGQIRPLLEEQFGRVFDRQVFSERNAKAPSEWPDPLIPATIASGNVVALGTGIDPAEDFNQLLAILEQDSYTVSGIAAQERLRASLRGMRNTTGDPIYQPFTATTPASIYSVPTQFVAPGTWNVAQALAICGDWSNAVYAMRQDITIQRFDTGVISDDDGKVVYNLLQQDMIAIRAVMRLAWQVSNPIDIDRQDTNRTYFPFAVLTPST